MPSAQRDHLKLLPTGFYVTAGVGKCNFLCAAIRAKVLIVLVADAIFAHTSKIERQNLGRQPGSCPDYLAFVQDRFFKMSQPVPSFGYFHLLPCEAAPT